MYIFEIPPNFDTFKAISLKLINKFTALSINIDTFNLKNEFLTTKYGLYVSILKLISNKVEFECLNSAT